MKSAETMPLRATGGDLLGWAESDPTFDLFAVHPEGSANAVLETARVRPALVATGRQVVWGFHYRAVWKRFPDRMFPIVCIGDAVGDEGGLPLLTALQYALIGENRVGRYQLSELDRIGRVVEHAGAVERDWGDVSRLVSAETDPWPLVKRFRALPAVLADAVDEQIIDLRTAEAIPGDLAIQAGRFVPLLSALSFSNRRRALRMVVELLRAGGDTDALVEEVARLSRRNVVPVLRERRYPKLTDLERRFDAVRRRTLSGTGVTLAPPDNFEGDRFQVSFTFRSATELRSRLNATTHLEDELDELLDLLF